jgi:hypothetical protein
MSTGPDDERLRDLLHRGLPAAEPADDLWERSHRRYRRVRAQRRASGALAAVLVLAALGAIVFQMLPRTTDPVVLDDGGTPAISETATPDAAPAPSPTPEDTPPAAPAPTSPPSAPAQVAPPAPSSPGLPCQEVPQPSTTLAGIEPDGDAGLERAGVEGSRLYLVDDGVVSAIDAGAPIVRWGYVDATGDGLAEFFVGTAGRAGQRMLMARITDCGLAFVRNVQGAPYAFDIGMRGGLPVGMGCVDTDQDGDVEIVGLEGRREGSEYLVTRTVVDVEGLRATNGEFDVVGVDAADTDGLFLISQATCGEDPLDIEGQAD